MGGHLSEPATATARWAKIALLLCLLTAGDVSSQAQTPGDVKQARKETAWRQRRIMYNDDGCDTRPFSTPEEFAALRLRQLTDTQVDTICFCTGGGGLFWAHVPKVGEAIGEFVSDNDEQYVKDLSSGLRALEKQGTDPLRVAIQFGHNHNMEVFWSCRMNNIEDSFASWGLSRWKREHPEYLMGKPEDYAKYPATDPHKWWSALDFAVPEVRDYLLRIFEDVCTRYDVDGIDMDWFRHPRFFRETNEDLPVGSQHVEMMNDFMRRIRALTEQAASKRGRPILVSGRVPLSVERCLAIGLDVETWLKEDLIDILVLGGDLGPMAMAPQLHTMAELAHRYRVPAVANICGSGLQEAHGYFTSEAWWAAAMNAWHAGVDGIYVFNIFPVERDERFSRLGSPDTLKGVDKLYAIDSIRPEALFGFDRAAIVVPDRLPIVLVIGQTVRAKLIVGEDIARNAPEGKTTSALLRVRLSSSCPGDEVTLRLNGTELGTARPTDAPVTTPGPCWFEAKTLAQNVRHGENLVDVGLTTTRPLDGPIPMDRLELEVRYQENKP